jgi:dTDP-4-dehydrorhamnose reductase
MKTLIFGQGWLGRRLHAELPGSLLSGARIDDPLDVRSVLDNHEPDTVINCAGKSGHPNVDWCEDHPLQVARSNTIGPLVLAQECAYIGARLIHLGSGCIFQGEGAGEASHAAPPSVYARSKYAADLALMHLPNVAIVRLRMPFDGVPHPRNLITKLAAYRRVINEPNSLTCVTDFVHVIRELVMRPAATGIFHAVNPGTMHHAVLLELYREIVDPSHGAVEWITTAELYSSGLAKAPRSNAVIANTRLPALGIYMRPVMEALRFDLAEYRTHFAPLG